MRECDQKARVNRAFSFDSLLPTAYFMRLRKAIGLQPFVHALFQAYCLRRLMDIAVSRMSMF